MPFFCIFSSCLAVCIRTCFGKLTIYAVIIWHKCFFKKKVQNEMQPEKNFWQYHELCTAIILNFFWSLSDSHGRPDIAAFFMD